MNNIVYKTNPIKPGDEIFLGAMLQELTANNMIHRDHVLAQAVAQRGPQPDEAGRAACFKLDDEGIHLFNHGFMGRPKGWKEWPTDGSELDFERYPIERIKQRSEASES